MMRYLYSAMCYLSVPVVLTRLLWRSRKNPGYRQRWGERFGFLPDGVPQNCLWIHAVSVGETLAAVPLVKGFQQKHPDVPVLVTTMTPNGAKQVVTSFGQTARHVYIPYDLPSAIQRFVNKIHPKMLIIMETELWPNLLHICQKQQIPVLLANARMSERSANNYSRFPIIVRPMLQALTELAVQTSVEADRFKMLGAPADRIEITGTVKFDIVISDEIRQRGKQFRGKCGVDRPVFIAASTHAGEDEIILEAFAQIRKQLPNALLLLTPRHPERAEDVAALCKKRGFSLVIHSENPTITQDIAIYLTDVIGQLLVLYAASDVAFVGGSLIPTGGHNVLEPAALGLPVITGPHMFNFTESERLLREASSLWQINNAEELANKVIQLLQDPVARQKAATAGLQVIEKNRGAVQKHLQIIEKLFNGINISQPQYQI